MKPYWSNGPSSLYHADARSIPLPDGSVHCAVTSPPYYGLRFYFDAVAIRADIDYNMVIEIERELERRGIKPITEE